MFLTAILLAACGGGEPAKTATPAPAPAPAAAPAPTPAPAAVGPDGPPSIPIPAIAAIPTDEASIEAGEKVFNDKGCAGCHKFGEKLVGPDFNGLFTRRTVPWVERMVLDPDRMTKEDPVARDLFRTLMVQMPKQGVPEADLANLLAYIKHKGG